MCAKAIGALLDTTHRCGRTRDRSRRGPVVHPPDPSLSSPIPQHFLGVALCIHVGMRYASWRFLIEGDKGMAQERQNLLTFIPSRG